MTRIYLVRHAEGEGNISRQFHGQHDSNITSCGAAQLEYLKKRFADEQIDIIYSSDLIRARLTAEAIKGDRTLDICFDRRLREMNGGKWEGCTWDDIVQEYKDCFDKWENLPHEHVMPQGESMRQLHDRMVEAMSEIIEANQGKTIAVASHGTAIKTWIAHIKYNDLSRLNDVDWYDNTAVTIIDFDKNNNPTLVLENDISHLPADLSTFSKQIWWVK